MTITKTSDAGKLTLAVEGRIDINTAPELDSEITASIEGVNELVIDMEQVVYISSAGLRVLLSAQKKMSAQGTMTLTNVSEDLMGIFEVTGFAEILSIQ